jgi:hypothetical protein
MSNEEQNAYLKAQIDSDPQGAFLSLAIGAFNEGNVKDFDYLAGMAWQYSGCSILTEIAMTLMKTMLILKINDPKCVKNNKDDNIEEILHKGYFLRLNLLTDLILDLIKQEKDGKLKIDNNLETNSRSILFGFIDYAVEMSRTITKTTV